MLNKGEKFDTNLFTPYAVGFDRTFDRLFDYATHQATSTGFPPYNIVKDGDYNYTIEMALAGYSKKDIEVEVVTILTVKRSKMLPMVMIVNFTVVLQIDSLHESLHCLMILL